VLQVIDGRDAKQVKDMLMAEGIMVRHYSKKELSGYIRVSVGKPEHTDVLQRALQQIC
jgi:histidinol-phosphate aminotransferase